MAQRPLEGCQCRLIALSITLPVSNLRSMHDERRPILSGGLQMVNVDWDGMINNKRKAPDRDLLVYDYTPTANIEFPWKAQPGLAALQRPQLCRRPP
ncbi:hypothetical protein NQZ68_032705 [Dissostichus eleginoides]|nr:hypothetical protein NQZ68_032705 [Dissostichus eleginoides]